MNTRKLAEKYKPGASRTVLLFLAALVWTFAGGLLLYKGFSMSPDQEKLSWGAWLQPLIPGFFGGALFYLLLFHRISLKHVQRIEDMPLERPCLFSFFSFRSYTVMLIMISMSILLKVLGLVHPYYMQLIDICMGIPLLLSSFRFYMRGFVHLFKK